MSEGELSTLRREIRDLSEKSDRQHADNQKSQQADRDAFRNAVQAQQLTFAAAMDVQRNAFQEAIDKQFRAHVALDKIVDRHATLLENCVGDGQPGKGRVGALETGMEVMKKFRWQALALIAFMMWVLEVWRHGG